MAMETKKTGISIPIDDWNKVMEDTSPIWVADSGKNVGRVESDDEFYVGASRIDARDAFVEYLRLSRATPKDVGDVAKLKELTRKLEELWTPLEAASTTFQKQYKSAWVSYEKASKTFVDAAQTSYDDYKRLSAQAIRILGDYKSNNDTTDYSLERDLMAACRKIRTLIDKVRPYLRGCRLE